MVPVDFDEPSRRAVALAVSYARALQGRIVLLHVLPPDGAPDARVQRMLEDDFVAMLVSGVAVRREVRTGHVIETVLRVAEESKASLVVVGTHGRTGAARMMLGSVAEGLVRLSPVPVLVAHEETRDAERDARPIPALSDVQVTAT